MIKSLVIFLLFPVLLFGQNVFDKVPIKGKIVSYAISRVSGDSLKPKLEIKEKVVYDNKGRLLTSYKKGNSIGAIADQEINIYEGNQVKNYKCDCTDLNDFIKRFAIRDNAELKNMPIVYTSHSPTKFVAITVKDPKSRTEVRSTYSEAGYKVGETTFAYNATDKPIKTERFDIDGRLTETQLYSYDKTGRVISQETRRPNQPDERYLWNFDSGQYYKEYLYYKGADLITHFKYSATPEADYKLFRAHNVLADKSYVEKRIYYDTAGREVKVVNVDYDGSLQSAYEYSYDREGSLKTYSVYNKDNVLHTGYEFENDARGNAIGVKVTQLVNERVGKETLQKYHTSRYIREIKYLK